MTFSKMFVRWTKKTLNRTCFLRLSHHTKTPMMKFRIMKMPTTEPTPMEKFKPFVFSFTGKRVFLFTFVWISYDIYVHFIFSDKPTKTDKSVYDAISNCDIDVTKYPYVYRWRHTVSLYTPKERERYFTHF